MEIFKQILSYFWLFEIKFRKCWRNQEKLNNDNFEKKKKKKKIKNKQK